MASEYDQETAVHYAAYRPPLHVPILQLGLKLEERFDRALDIGCGTGRSTFALRNWCDDITGTDPSPEMIAAAVSQPGVQFSVQAGTDIAGGLPTGAFDLICFAGSLFYLDAREALQSLEQLLTPNGTVIVYDFNVLLSPVFAKLGVTVAAGDYLHAKNFSDLSQHILTETISLQDNVSFTTSRENLAHLLFSVQAWRQGPLAAFSFTSLQAALPKRTELEAEVFLTRYEKS